MVHLDVNRLLHGVNEFMTLLRVSTTETHTRASRMEGVLLGKVREGHKMECLEKLKDNLPISGFSLVKP